MHRSRRANGQKLSVSRRLEVYCLMYRSLHHSYSLQPSTWTGVYQSSSCLSQAREVGSCSLSGPVLADWIRWKDAERDCSSAINLLKGDTNVKALYRRALARKALLDVGGALEGESRTEV
jgi:hypothetical protein